MFPFVKSGIIPDPYVFTDYKVHVTYSTTAGRTAVSTTLTPGEKTLVAFVAGQSLGGNHGVTLYSPTNATKVQNFFVPDNTLYQMVDPVLGATGTDGTFIGRLGDKLINAGIYQRVIFIPLAIGASSILDWSPQGSYNHRLIGAALRAKALGWLDANSDVDVMVLFQQGEADNVFGTTTSTYVSTFLTVQDTLISRGIDIPWLLAKSTMVENVVDSDIRIAIDTLIDESQNRYAGPDTDTLTSSVNRQVEGTHLTDIGNDANATLWRSAIQAYLE